MTYWNKSVLYGGIYASALHQEYRGNPPAGGGREFAQIYKKIAIRLENWQEMAKIAGEKSKEKSLYISKRLKSHILRKQEVYWPVFIAVSLLVFVLASRMAFAQTAGVPNNLPIEDNSKLNLIGFTKAEDLVKMSLANAQPTQGSQNADNTDGKKDEKNNDAEMLKEDVAGIVENTPMAAMIDPISEKDRTVAAFIVGIAMKESKFGVYSPHIGGRDCFNYWGFKGGGKTTSGGYTCFASPEDAVDAVAKRIEKMVDKGVHTPAQAIGWKCGSSCAGHDPAGVRKWISDVAINFNKINS